MSERDDYPHGVPCWVTNLSPDLPESMAFYSALFGWEFETDPTRRYGVARLRGRDVAGIGSLDAAGPGVEPTWMTEVRVDSADEAAERAPAAGGQLLAGPMDIDPAGRLSVLADPSGAVLCAFESGVRKGAQLVNEPSAWAMSFLSTPDPAGSVDFYAALFGWETEPYGETTMCRLPGYVGGEEAQPVPRDVVAGIQAPNANGHAQWNVNFWIADADAGAATAERHGGRVLSAPTEAGPFRTATLADPAGAAFSVSQLML